MAISSDSIEILFDFAEYGDDAIKIRDVWNSYELTAQLKNDVNAIVEIENVVGFTYDRLSQLLYNTRNFWWLIALVSGIQNPYLIGSDVIDTVSNPVVIKAIKGDVLNQIIIGLRNR